MPHRFYKFILFLLLTGLVLGAGLFSLTGKPAVWFDEGIYLHVGRVLADEGVFGIQVAPGQFEDLSIISVGYTLIAPQAMVVKFFGASILSARLLMVFFIAGFVLCFFLLARKMYGTKPAFVSVLLLASFAPLYGNGKSVIGEVPGLFFMALGLLFLYSIETDKESGTSYSIKKRYFYSLLAGLGLGLSASTKPVFLVLTGALFVAITVCIRFWKQRLRELLNIAIGFVLPLLVWVSTQFSGDFSIARILEFYSNPYVLQVDIIINFIKINALRFFTESTPIHFAIMLVAGAIFFIIKQRNKERIYSSEIVIFVFIGLVLAAYLRTPGWYRYLFPAHVMLFLFLPIACMRVESLIKSRWRFPDRHVAFFVLFLLSIVQLGHFIKEEYNYTKDGTELSRIYMNTIPVESSIVFYNASELAFLYPYKNFSQYLRINDDLQLGKKSLIKLNRGEYDFLAIPIAYLDENFTPHCYAFEYKAGKYAFLTKDTMRCPKAISL